MGLGNGMGLGLGHRMELGLQLGMGLRFTMGLKLGTGMGQGSQPHQYFPNPPTNRPPCLLRTTPPNPPYMHPQEEQVNVTMGLSAVNGHAPPDFSNGGPKASPLQP